MMMRCPSVTEQEHPGNQMLTTRAIVCLDYHPHSIVSFYQGGDDMLSLRCGNMVVAVLVCPLMDLRLRHLTRWCR